MIKFRSYSGSYFVAILVFTFVLFTFIFSSGQSNPSVSDLSIRYTIQVKILYFVLAFFPLYWLFFSQVWKNTLSIPRKILLMSLGAFLISLFYSTRYGINTGGVFIACALIFAVTQRRMYRPNKVFYWFWAYLLIHIISLIWTNDLHGGLENLRVYLPFFTFSVAFCCFQLTKEEIDRLFLLFFRGATLFIFLSLFCWIYESSRIGVPLLDWLILHKSVFASQAPYSIVFDWVGYDHPSYLSISYILALAIGIYLFDKRKSSCGINLFELVVFALSALTLTIIVQSRIGLVNFMVITISGTAWLLRKNKRYLYGYFFICLLLAVYIAFKIDIILNFIIDPIRGQQYHTAIFYIKTNPWFGTGIGGMTKIMTSQELALKLGYPYASVINIYPSNQFLGDLMQTGIFGFIILIGMLTFLSYNCVKQRNWVFFSIIITFLLMMVIEMPFILLRGTTLFVILSCLVLQFQNRNEDILFYRK